MVITAHMEDEGHSSTIGSDGTPILTYTEMWVMTDNTGSLVNIHQARLNFKATTGITEGGVYANYPFAFCRTITPKKRATRPPNQAWDVQVEYTTDCPVIDDPDPSKRRWKRKVSDSDQQRFIVRDKNNRLIVDTAGTPFDGGVPVNVKLTSYNWEHNVDWSVYRLDSIKRYSGALNSDTFLGCEPYTLMMTYSAEEDWEGKYHFAHEFYTAIYDPLGWRPKPANAGLYQIVTDQIFNKKRQRIQIDGKPATEPEPLDINGVLIPYAQRPQACIFVTVDYYNAIPFSSIGLPVT